MIRRPGKPGAGPSLAGILLIAGLLVGTAEARRSQTSGEASQDAALTSLKKSLLIPGWGQFSEQRYVEGVLFLGAEIACIYQIFSHNHKGNFYYARYRDAANVDDAVSYRALTEDHDKKRNWFILGAVGVWALNLLDIYVIVAKKRNRKLELRLDSGDHKAVLSLRYRF